MSVYFNGAVTVNMPVAAGVINNLLGAVTVDMPTAAGTLAASIPYLAGATTVDMPVAAATMAMPPVLAGAVTVNMPVAAGVIAPVIGLSGAVTVDMPTVTGVIVFGLNGAVVVDMPVAAGIVAGSIPILDGAVTVDMPTVAAALGFATPSAFTCLVMNLSNRGVSTYTGYNFNSACVFNGQALGANSTGIHQLSGTTDNGTAIAASFTLGASDFGVSEHFNIPDIYLDFSGPSAMTVTMAVDSGTESAARSITAPASGLIETRRAKLSLGTEGRHWQPKIANVSGGDFEIQGAELPLDITSRRI